MFSKKVVYGSAVVLAFGTLLNTIGRFSPWMFTVKGPNVYNDAKNKVVHGTINFGWFYLQACDSRRCYTQSMSERYGDHNTHANTTMSVFSETWLARRVGEQTIEVFALLFNIAGLAGTGFLLYTWKTQTKLRYAVTLVCATVLLISASLEWANLGEVLAEMGSIIRYNDPKIQLYTPSSLVLSGLGSTCMFAVSVLYYLAVMMMLYQHSDITNTAGMESQGQGVNGGNDVTPAQAQSHIESLEVQVNTDQTSV
ncbi:uncharacterized protein LOC110449047 [Mizuhopecten yessoensis]|uniref:Uncharacterized protein n=1 Tax=Mizuhopecten yessoensis TaxID=6573 RepID=A0A210QS23_MIZYE|nr:uncharacterized protein LOC110449047 [Mizuhopecten yessoensis]OWF51521.1 hypothetical protein KP79_PYT20532 [Mizuhopecten yessoensis]